MGCGCKTKEKINESSNNAVNNRSVSNIIVGLLAFILSFFLIPFMVIAMVWFMFDLLVLNKEIDMKRIITVLSSKIKRFNEDEEEDDFDIEEDDFDIEEFEELNVEDITPQRV
jgi:hypothetical protein